jgi:hypothetical protein
VRGQRQQVDVGGDDIERHFAGSLGGVGVEEGALRVCDRGDFGERLDGPNLVVGRHDADENRARPDRAGEGLEVDEAVGANADHGHLAAVLRKRSAHVEHRLVLDGAGHDVTAAASL